MAQPDVSVPPLTADELEYKRIFFKHPEARLDQARTLRDIRALVPELAAREAGFTTRPPEDYLHERNFPGDFDVLVLPSYRYAAAFLHAHSFFEVVCVLNGECNNIFPSGTVRMTAGDVCIIAPGTVHALSVFQDDCIVYNLTVRSETFQDSFLKALPDDGVLTRFFTRALYESGKESHLDFRAEPDPDLNRLVLHMRSEYRERKRYTGTLLNALLTAFFVYLLRNHEKDIVLPDAGSVRVEGNLIYILSYIEQHYKTVTLAGLAAFFGYSERQMIRILQTYTGESFRSLVQRAKLARACDMLRHPEISISDILAEVGYTNASHFYSLFQKKYGLTPSEYRKRNSEQRFELIE